MQQIPAYQLPLDYSGAIFPSRLQWLCQPEQIEQTLRLLYYLNSWKKASQQLLYADRQGLCEIQALVLEHAVKAGMMQVNMYIDRTRRFPGELLIGSVAETVARQVGIHLKGLRDPDIWPPFCPDGDRVYQEYIRPLCKRITGQDFKFVADAANALEPAQIRAYVEEQLQKLVARAKATHQPLPVRRLAALCIAPVDLLPIRDNRVYFLDGYETWDDLDISDQRKLDPEGYSEVALRYGHASTEFIFHLPLRWAETFVPGERLRELQRIPGISQERGIYRGLPIDEAESLKHPARDILQDLGVDIASACPHKLLEKESYLTQPAIRDILWPTRGCDPAEWEDDPWNGICLPPNLV